jgi:hypothetical protein
MNRKRRAAAIQFRLRQWSKKRLTEDDYKFAVSDHRENWNSLTHRLWNSSRQAAKKAVAAMLDWEFFRELQNCKSPPFLAIKEHQERIKNVLDMTTLLKPAEIEPLKHIPLDDAVERNTELSSGVVPGGIRVHAFEIEWDEKTDVSVQRFKNWLVAHKQGPDPRSRTVWATNAAGVPERRIQCPNTEMKLALARRGRLRYNSVLIALAVRRLKVAGYKRSEAEKLLGLKSYALNPRLKTTQGGNLWNKLPKLAQREIENFVRKITPVYAPDYKIFSP